MFVTADAKQHCRPGQHDLNTRKQGKARTDAYSRRTSVLIKADESLVLITDAHVKVQVLPTRPRGQTFEMQSKGFPAPEPGSQGTATVSKTEIPQGWTP